LKTGYDHLGILDRVSSYAKLRRVIAYCRRFRPANKYNGALYAQEIVEAEIQILKILQASQFHNEIESLKTKNRINRELPV